MSCTGNYKHYHVYMYIRSYAHTDCYLSACTYSLLPYKPIPVVFSKDELVS